MDRRAFLTTAWMLLTATPLALWLGAGCSAAPSAEQRARSLVGRLAGNPDVAALGRRILAADPAGPTLEVLSAALVADWPEPPPVAPEETSRRLQRQIREDFVEGRTAEIDGWLLSLTEARLSALVALL